MKQRKYYALKNLGRLERITLEIYRKKPKTEDDYKTFGFFSRIITLCLKVHDLTQNRGVINISEKFAKKNSSSKAYIESKITFIEIVPILVSIYQRIKKIVKFNADLSCKLDYIHTVMLDNICIDGRSMPNITKYISYTNEDFSRIIDFMASQDNSLSKEFVSTTLFMSLTNTGAYLKELLISLKEFKTSTKELQISLEKGSIDRNCIIARLIKKITRCIESDACNIKKNYQRIEGYQYLIESLIETVQRFTYAQERKFGNTSMLVICSQTIADENIQDSKIPTKPKSPFDIQRTSNQHIQRHKNRNTSTASSSSRPIADENIQENEYQDILEYQNISIAQEHSKIPTKPKSPFDIQRTNNQHIQKRENENTSIPVVYSQFVADESIKENRYSRISKNMTIPTAQKHRKIPTTPKSPFDIQLASNQHSQRHENRNISTAVDHVQHTKISVHEPIYQLY